MNELTVRVREDLMLPDKGNWINRFEIKSESSNRVYVVAQDKNKKHFGCSCPGWKIHRTCKHLRALNLPSYEQPVDKLLMIKY